MKCTTSCGERRVEDVVVEGQLLGDAVADIGPRVARGRRGDEARGRIDAGDLGLAVARGELLGERARTAADIERAALDGGGARSRRTARRAAREYRPMKLSYASAATSNDMAAVYARWF